MTAAISLSRLEPNIPRAYFDYALRSVIRTRDAIVDATAPFQTRTATLVEEAIAIGADVVVGFECCRVGRRVRKVFILLQARYGIRVVRTTISSGSRVKVCRTRSRFAGMLSPLGLGLGFGRRPGKKKDIRP
jgi:hypothetical protein